MKNFLVSTFFRATVLTMAVVVPGLVLAAPQGQAELNNCSLLPMAEIETLYGSKAALPANYYGSETGATCTVSIAGGFVRVVSAAPAAAGVASTVHDQLAALQSKIAAGTRNPPKVEAKDYGDVGCLRLAFTTDPSGKVYDKPFHQTICFQVTGGYLLLHLASSDEKVLADDHVKALLAKAAEKRKASARTSSDSARTSSDSARTSNARTY